MKIKHIIIYFFSVSVLAQGKLTNDLSIGSLYPKSIPSKSIVWVFILAGQSNMAGRGVIETMDTIMNPRILSINSNGELILAKEPLNIYEPTLKGLDCGVSFGNELLNYIPNTVSILIIPTAIGGSSIDQWMEDSLHRNVNLLSNFRQKVALAKKYGEIKGLLWHQGESDAKEALVNTYPEKLNVLFERFRKIINNSKLPIFTGEIGTFTTDSTFQKAINSSIVNNANKDKYTFLIQTHDFSDRGDKLHYDSRSQRLMGKRFAQKYIEITNKL